MTGSVVDRYSYPAEEMELRRKDELKLTDGSKFGDVIAVDRSALSIDVRKGPKQANQHPTAAFAHSHVPSEVLEDSIFQIGETFASSGRVSPSGP